MDGVATLTAPAGARLSVPDPYWAGRLIRAYGTEAWAVLGSAKTADDLGRTLAPP